MADPIWYYAIDDQEHGPVTAAALKELASRGQLRPQHLVWKAGLNDWTAAKNVAGLFPAESKAPAEGGNGEADHSHQPETSDDLLYQRGTQSAPAVAPEPSAEISEPPVEPAGEQPPEPDFEPEPPPAEEPYYNEPPAPPPVGTHVPTGMPVTGEYRPQERIRKPGLAAGPVTLRVARMVVIGSLLMLVCLQGCETLGTSYVNRLDAMHTGAEDNFLALWEQKRASLKKSRNELQAQTNKSAADSMSLGRILDDLESLDSDMAEARLQLEDTEWLALEIAARQARSNHQQRLWWFNLFRLPLTLLLTGGGLLLALYSEGQQRWLGLGLVLLVMASMLLIFR